MPSSGEGSMLVMRLEPAAQIGLIGTGVSLISIVIVLLARRRMNLRTFIPCLVFATLALFGSLVLAISPYVEIITKVSSGSADDPGG